MDRVRHAKQYLELPIAAATVYCSVTGQHLDEQMGSFGGDLLCDVAHALSVLAPIYAAEHPSTPPVPIPVAQLIGARFKDAAGVLVTAGGARKTNLAIQRGDMLAAIAVLKECGFQRRWKK